MAERSLAPFSVGGFLSWLRSQGFTIGVDSHLVAQQLLERAGPECSPGDLKTILCPLFARSQEQQEAFYRSFDRWFDLFAEPIEAEPGRDHLRFGARGGADTAEPSLRPPSFQRRTRARWYAAAGLLLILMAVAGYWLAERPPATAPASNAVAPAAPVAEQPTTPRPSATKTAPKPSPGPRDAVPLPEQPAQSPAPSEAPSFLSPQGTLTRWGMAAIPLVLFLLYEARRARRRRFVLQKQKSRNAPYSWPVRIQSGRRVYHSPQFYAATRRLQRRQRGDALILDVDASVQATVGSLGFPTLKYKSDSRLPEYLLLIDRASYRDHQGQLFEALGRALREDGLFVTILFYDGDPRVCQTERQDTDVYLADVERRHSADRLILFGDGEKLIDPVTGRLVGWATVFQSWNRRAVLTPVPPTDWKLNERALAGEFVVLPASVDGLFALVNHFERSTRPDLRTWREGSTEPRVPDLDGEGAIQNLREYLGPPAFEWLCRCAVYPELHWDLTLHLGSLVGAGENTITETNLLRLIRLPWFRTGSIPEELRWALIQELGPASQNAVRESILQLLEESPPPKDSFAFDLRSFQIVFQRYCFNRRDRKARRALIEALRGLPPAELHRDHTILKSLESMRVTALDFVLPLRLRRMLYANGVPAFGLKSGVRFLAVAPACLLLSCIGLSFLNNRALESEVRSSEAAVRSLPLPGTDLVSFEALQKLETLRQVVKRLQAYQREGPPLTYRLGLYVGNRLYGGARAAYFDGLQKLLLVPTQRALEQSLLSLPDTPVAEHEYEPTYDSLKAYLILTSNHDRADTVFLPTVLTLWWHGDQSIDTRRLALTRAQFDFYAEELKHQNMYAGNSLEQAIAQARSIARARGYLNQFQAPERVYFAMLSEADRAGKPINFNRDFPGSELYLIDNYEIRGAFSKDGWKYMQDAIAHADRYFAREDWVLGNTSLPPVNRATLAANLASRYRSDFIREWTTFIRSAKLVRFPNLRGASARLKQLAGDQSPLLALCNVASQNTSVDDAVISRAFQPLRLVTSEYAVALAHLQLSIDVQLSQWDASAASKIAMQVNESEAVVNQLAHRFPTDSPIGGVLKGLLVDPIQQVRRLAAEPITQSAAAEGQEGKRPPGTVAESSSVGGQETKALPTEPIRQPVPVGEQGEKSTPPKPTNPPPPTGFEITTSLPTSPGGDVSKARRVALVIGNSAYSSLPRLPSAAKDADAIVDALRNSGFKAEDVMRIDNFTTADMFNRVGAFEQRVKKGDVCVIYYAGYSVSHEGDNYLLPVDFDPRRPVDLDDAYLFFRFADRLDRFGLALKIFIVEGPPRLNIANTGIGLADPQIGASTKTRETAFISAGRLGDFVAISPDGVDVFTATMAKAINEQKLELNQLFAKVRTDVIAATGNSRQSPFAYSSADVTFYFHEPSKVEPTVITQEIVKPLAWPRTGVPVTNDKDHEEYVWIPPQTFRMGCVPSSPCEDAEKPQHQVTLTRGFWLGRNEVQVESFAHYVDVNKKIDRKLQMPKAPIINPKWQHTNYPMVDVRWEDANGYCTWAGGRLPTEAEWEAAARAGRRDEVYPGNSDRVRDYGNFDGTGGNDTYTDLAPVRRFTENPYRLFDMSGNVWEWVSDWFGPYRAGPEADPRGPESGSAHVIRGGSFQSNPKIHLRLSYRKGSKNDDLNIGFRCAINSLPKPAGIQ